MRYRPFRSLIEKLFGAAPDAGIDEGSESRRLNRATQPMTDKELARAIREFQARHRPGDGCRFRRRS